MKQLSNKISLLLGTLLVPLIGCGGGGGGSDEAEFAGVWNGSANFVEDTCPEAREEFSIFFAHLVNQDGSVIILDNGASAFQGTASESGFNAALTREARAPLPFPGDCEELITWRYEQIERDVASFVVRTSTITCDEGATRRVCTKTFTGSAYRQNDQPGFPIPVDIGGGIGDSPEPADGAVTTEGAVSDTLL